jgi:hypothetical protein
MHEEEWERRRVRGEEAVARKGGFGNEERDGWGFLRSGCCCGCICICICCWAVVVGAGGLVGNAGRKLGRRRVGYAGAGGGVSVYDALELAQVCGAHLPLFGFALGEDAQSAPTRYVAAHGLYGSVERI